MFFFFFDVKQRKFKILNRELFMNVFDHFEIQKRYNEAVEKNLDRMKFVLNYFKTQGMYEKVLKGFHIHFHMFLISLRPNICVKVLF